MCVFLQASWNKAEVNGLYSHVIELHDAYSAIVAVIRETGALQRQVAELEEQVGYPQGRG